MWGLYRPMPTGVTPGPAYWRAGSGVTRPHARVAGCVQSNLAVTDPRNIAPGKTWLVTTRCLDRVFAFTPGPMVNELFAFLLAYCAAEHGVGLHGYVVQSNHAHFVLTDHRGVLPDMFRTLNSLLARGLNAARGRTGSVLERNNVDMKELHGLDAVVTMLVYVAANPVAAGCVAHGREWPGLRSQAKEMGKEGVLVRRPDWLFLHRLSSAYRGSLPASAQLTMELPPGVTELDRGRFLHQVERQLGEREAAIRAEFAAKGRGFLGAAACRSQDPNRSATTPEPHGPGTGPSPVMASDSVMQAEAIAQLLSFRAAYREARARWAGGHHDVIFPHGTWCLARYHGARVAQPGASPPG